MPVSSFPFSPAGCCDCLTCGTYVSDSLTGRSDLGSGYTINNGSWTISANTPLTTSSSSASVTVNSGKPSGASGYSVLVTVEGSAGDVATLAVENGDYEVKITFGSGGKIEFSHGGNLVASQENDATSLTVTICVTDDLGGLVIASGFVSSFSPSLVAFAPTQSNTHVILGTGAVSGSVQFSNLTISTTSGADVGSGGRGGDCPCYPPSCSMVGYELDIVFSGFGGSCSDLNGTYNNHGLATCAGTFVIGTPGSVSYSIAYNYAAQTTTIQASVGDGSCAGGFQLVVGSLLEAWQIGTRSVPFTGLGGPSCPDTCDASGAGCSITVHT